MKLPINCPLIPLINWSNKTIKRKYNIPRRKPVRKSRIESKISVRNPRSTTSLILMSRASTASSIPAAALENIVTTTSENGVS